MSTSKLAEIAKRVKHNPEQHKFCIDFDDDPEQAVVEYEEIAPGQLNYWHTYVPPKQRGGGTAFAMSEVAMDYIVQNNLKVRLSCSYLDKMFGSEAKYKPFLLK